MTELISFILSKLLFFSLYFEGSASFPKPLTSSEELKAFLEFKEEGSEKARERLIEHNLRLVAHIAKKYYNSLGGEEDLISIGTIGLIKAVNSFSPKKGTRFATYAARCIENEILMHFRAAKKCAQDVFISDPIDTDSDGNTLTLSDIIKEDVDMLENVDTELKTARLYKYIGLSLDKREKEIISHRYGLFGKSAKTQIKTAKEMGISRSYVSRIEKKALEKLYKCFKKDGIE